MLGLYFIIKYTSSKKIRYAVFSAISTSIAYMLRMNFLIFILATLIYLLLDLLNKENKKVILKKILVITGLILIVFLPSSTSISPKPEMVAWESAFLPLTFIFSVLAGKLTVYDVTLAEKLGERVAPSTPKLDKLLFLE